MKIFNECVSNYVVFNNQLVTKESIDTLVVPQHFFYEILRVIDSVPLFVEDHYQRFITTASLVGCSIAVTEYEFIKSIVDLIIAERLQIGNIKIVAFVDIQQSLTIVVYQIQDHYPSGELYKHGISTITVCAERNNPNAKQNLPVRDMVNALIVEKSVFEAFYVDSDNTILEGSRTNLFFVKNKTVYTAPSHKVLKGITRKYVSRAIENAQLSLIENDICFDDISTFEAAFVTGTSPKVLPIAMIDSIHYNPHHKSIVSVMKEFDRIYATYIATKKESVK